MGPIGAQEMILIVLVALVMFGPKKLPELGRMLGKGLSEFRRAKSELKSTFESHMQELDREARAAENAKLGASSSAASSTPEYQPASYPYPYDEYGRHSSSYESSAEPYGNYPPAIEPGSTPSLQVDSNNGSQAPRVEAVSNGSHPVPDTVARTTSSRSIEPAISLRDEEHPA